MTATVVTTLLTDPMPYSVWSVGAVALVSTSPNVADHATSSPATSARDSDDTSCAASSASASALAMEAVFVKSGACGAALTAVVTATVATRAAQTPNTTYSRDVSLIVHSLVPRGRHRACTPS